MASYIEVRKMTPEDVHEAVLVTQAAFMDDPYFHWIYPDMKTFNKARNYTALCNRYHWGMEQGFFYVALETTPATPTPTTKVVGVSTWLPPHPLSEPASWAMWWSDWKLSMRQLLTNARFLGRGGLDVHRYTIWKEVQDKAATETWTDRRGYYFCQTVAVLPGQQGKGIGKMLLKAVMDRADQEGFHCYLESTRYTPNVEIYKKHGFKVIKEITCKDASDACTIWCMVRDPQDPK